MVEDEKLRLYRENEKWDLRYQKSGKCVE